MTDRPRVLLLSTAYLPLVGGSELAIRHLTERMHGYDFDLVTGRHSPDMPIVEQMGRVRVFRAGGRLARLAILLPKSLMPIPMAITAWRLSQNQQYSVIHAYQASQAAGAAWLLKAVFRARPPFLLTLQEGKNLDRQSLLLRWFRRLIFTQVDAVTAISGYLCGHAKRFTRAPCTLVPNGVTIRDVPHVENPDPTILTVSRLVQKNNVEAVIRAFAIVRQSVPNARLLIVGDGTLRSDLQAISSKLGVRDVVDFRGTVSHDDLPAVYAAADVFVRPSLSEGLGSVFLEAMAGRVPVVASPVGGIPDIVHDGQTGLLVAPGDPADIARAIVRLIEDRPLRERLIENAHRMVREQYDWNMLAQRMEKVYEHLTQ